MKQFVTKETFCYIVKLNLKSRNSKSGYESSLLGCTEWVLPAQLDITKNVTDMCKLSVLTGYI